MRSTAQGDYEKPARTPPEHRPAQWAGSTGDRLDPPGTPQL